MGFGILFFGYLLLFFCRGAELFPDTLAYILIFIALRTLTRHSEHFKNAKLFAMMLLPVGVVTDVFLFLGKFTPFEAGFVSEVMQILSAMTLLIFHYFLFEGIRALALELHLPKIADHARRNWWITVLYYVLVIFTSLRLCFMEEAMRYFGILVLVIGVCWIVLNAVLIYSCYMKICLEGDEDMDYANGIFRLPDLSKSRRKKNASDSGNDKSGRRRR